QGPHLVRQGGRHGFLQAHHRRPHLRFGEADELNAIGAGLRDPGAAIHETDKGEWQAGHSPFSFALEFDWMSLKHPHSAPRYVMAGRRPGHPSLSPCGPNELGSPGLDASRRPGDDVREAMRRDDTLPRESSKP